MNTTKENTASRMESETSRTMNTITGPIHTVAFSNSPAVQTQKDSAVIEAVTVFQCSLMDEHPGHCIHRLPSDPSVLALSGRILSAGSTSPANESIRNLSIYSGVMSCVYLGCNLIIDQKGRYIAYSLLKSAPLYLGTFNDLNKNNCPKGMLAISSDAFVHQLHIATFKI